MLKTTTKKYRYGLVCFRDVTYLDSPLAPQEFIEHTLVLRDVLNVCSRSHFEIWHFSESMWHPVYGCNSSNPVRELTGAASLDYRRAKEQEFVELGHKVVKMYVEWQRRIKQFHLQVSRLEKDAPFAGHLMREESRLIRNCQLIDDVVSNMNHKKADLQTLFDLKYRKDFGTDKIAGLLHISNSTINRYTNDLKRIIGANLHRILSNDEIEETFHMEWRYEKWGYANGL